MSLLKISGTISKILAWGTLFLGILGSSFFLVAAALGFVMGAVGAESDGLRLFGAAIVFGGVVSTLIISFVAVAIFVLLCAVGAPWKYTKANYLGVCSPWCSNGRHSIVLNFGRIGKEAEMDCLWSRLSPWIKRGL